jgi:cell division septation protein DedD
MNGSRRSELWISGIAGVVCLLLLNLLVWQFRKEPSLRIARVDLVRSVSQGEHLPAPSHEQRELRRAEAAVSSTAATKGSLQPQVQAAQHSLRSEQAKLTVIFQFPRARPQAVAPPQRKTITLEPLSYVEKADGRVEATISLGERIHVVHEGEIFEVNFRVAKISSSAVELVENSTPAAEPHHLMAEIGQGVAQAPANKAQQMPRRPVPEGLSNPGADRPLAADSAASVSQPSVGQELGYVETADGRVEAIIAEGEHIRLSQATKSFANEFHGPAASPANGEVAKASPPAINPPDSLALESQPLGTNSFTQEAGEPPLIASGSEPSIGDKAQGIPAGGGESESEPPGILQPEALADFAGSAGRRSGANIPQPLVPPLPAVEPTPPSDRSENQSEVRTLGYVEKAGGEKEAIVEVLGQVYLVHEGESFAEKDRPSQVTVSSAAAQPMRMSSTTQVRPEISGFGVSGAIQGIFAVQVGAFRDRSNAEELKKRIESQFGPVNIQDFDCSDGLLYRVRVGHETSEDAARALAQSLRRAKLATETFVVRLN